MIFRAVNEYLTPPTLVYARGMLAATLLCPRPPLVARPSTRSTVRGGAAPTVEALRRTVNSADERYVLSSKSHILLDAVCITSHGNRLRPVWKCVRVRV